MKETRLARPSSATCPESCAMRSGPPRSSVPRAAGDHLRDALHGLRRHRPGLLHAGQQRHADGRDGWYIDRAAADAQQTDVLTVRTPARRYAPARCWSAPSRRDGDRQRSGPGGPSTMRWMSVERRAPGWPAIASIRSLACSPAFAAAVPGITPPTTGRVTGMPIAGEQQAEQHHGQQEIRDRPGRDDDGALPDHLFVKRAPGDPGGADLGATLLRPFLAVQLHVAAQRQPGELPARCRAGPSSW